MASFCCYDNSDVIATLTMTDFYLNTTMVAIFPNVRLWRRSLCSNLVLTLKTNCIEPPSYASTAYDSFVEIWGTCEIFWANSLSPLLAKNLPYAYAPAYSRPLNEIYFKANKQIFCVLNKTCNTRAE